MLGLSIRTTLRSRAIAIALAVAGGLVVPACVFDLNDVVARPWEGHAGSAGAAGGPLDAGNDADAVNVLDAVNLPDAIDIPEAATSDAACSTAGELNCGGHAQQLRLRCDGTSWVSNGVCPGEQRCDTRPGATLGTCQDPVPLCVGQAPGAHLCDGSRQTECGPDLVSVTSVDCPFVCSAGNCAGECKPGDKQCSGTSVQTCQSSGEWDTGAACPSSAPLCQNAQCVGRSCDGVAPTCGPSGNATCCASSLVGGGKFYRSYDGSTRFDDKDNPATVSDFRLDLYEVTVGRFRKFVEGFPDNMPEVGAGKNPKCSYDPGWASVWNQGLPADRSELMSRLDCHSPVASTWTDTAGSSESKPISCINWFEAFAFCIWDGGRLPTEAEWNYAAAGGSDQRVYPWSVPANSTTIDSSYAVYDNAPIAVVGSKSTKGDGKWGQADMAGNVWEWVRDWYHDDYLIPCDDCCDVDVATGRVTRGGSTTYSADFLVTSVRSNPEPYLRFSDLGVRCVRTP
jgi:formylglycine-generating enzyme